LEVTLNPGDLYLAPEQQQVKEKNWMPFVYNGRLHVVHSLHPTRVYELDTKTGKSVVGYITRAADLIAAAGLPAAKLHGGPPVVLVTKPGQRLRGARQTLAVGGIRRDR
jgi:hypothetical protein